VSRPRRLSCLILSGLALLGLAVAVPVSAAGAPIIPTLTIRGHSVFGSHTVPAGYTVRAFNGTSSVHTFTAKVDGVFRPGIFTTGDIPPGGRGSFVAPDRIGEYHFGSTHDPKIRDHLYVRQPLAASKIRGPAAQTVPAGSEAHFVTKLVDRPTGEPIVGARVYLAIFVPGQRPSFQEVLERTTGPTGHAAAGCCTHIRVTRQYRWMFPGDAQHEAARSKVVTITVE
jgi:hypothetical protein